MKRAILTLLAAAALLAASPAPAQDDRITVDPKEGGWKLSELFRTVAEYTGVKIVYDPEIGEQTIEFVGTQEVPKEHFFTWFQSLLSFQRILLVPTEEGVWQAMRARPYSGCRPIFVPEREIEDWADRDAVFLVSTLVLSLPELTDRAVRLAESLATEEIGSVLTTPNSEGVVLADFAPRVALIYRAVRAMEEEWAAAEIGRLEKKLAACRTEAAALYLVERIKGVRHLVRRRSVR